MAENNPIQERVNLLLQKWTLAINSPGVKLVRIHAAHDERDIVDAFFEYMLALDTEQEDFVMVLEEPFSTHQDYARHLLEEIEEEINLWNEAEIPETVPFEKIEWKPDYTLGDDKNVTSLLVRNLNNFANYLVPEKDTKVSIVIRMPQVGRHDATRWFNDLLKVKTESHLVFGTSDAETNAVFSKVADQNPQKVTTIKPNLDMDEAVEQLTALGEPNSPETPYRTHLAKLMHAVKNRKKKEVQTHGKECLTIATEELNKDVNWLSQIVTVYTILYNDQVGYKNYDRAIYFASKAVEAALLTEGLIDPEMSKRLVGQSHIGRGSLYTLQRKWETALIDFKIAAEAYSSCSDYVMLSESLRLCGWACEKTGANQEASKHYIRGYELVHKLSPELVKGSTFPYILKKLVNSSERLKVISDAQMDEDLTPIFGEHWRAEVADYGKIKNAV